MIKKHPIMREVNAVATIAARDVIKFLRDRPRLIATFMFPVIFIGVLGGSLQANLGRNLGYNFLTFVFVGVLGQTLFQSTASGIISLIEDRENDFSQEMFVSPISRFSIILGKIVGESFVSFLQCIGIVGFGLIARVPLSFTDLLKLIPFGVVACLLGGSFGILVMSQLNNQRSANQLFPFLIFPQFFLSGVFNPIKELPPILLVLSRIAPMTYAVDLMRSIYYFGKPEASKVVLFNPLINLAACAAIFLVFVTVGTYFFINNERNR
jgi:ABC-2 type transport system permease protein